MSVPAALLTSDKQDWATPPEWFEAAQKIISPYDYDLCATKKSTKCATYFSLEEGEDAFNYAWGVPGARFWANPPYGDPKYKVEYWVEKAWEAATQGALVTLLLPINKQDQPWFHKYAIPNARIDIVQGRIQFLDPETGKKSKHGNTQGSMFVTFAPDIQPHVRSFGWRPGMPL